MTGTVVLTAVRTIMLPFIEHGTEKELEQATIVVVDAFITPDGLGE